MDMTIAIIPSCWRSILVFNILVLIVLICLGFIWGGY